MPFITEKGGFISNKQTLISLKSIIQDNILYLASPKDFNDPFDCRINSNFSLLSPEEGEEYKQTPFGLFFSAGTEFDIYKNKIYAGISLNYHMVFFKDAKEEIGAYTKNGNYFNLLCSLMINY